MSKKIMYFNDLFDKPNTSIFEDVINGQRLDLIAPFATSWALRQLDPIRHTHIRIITRLPATGTPPYNIDNNPGDFLDLISRCGRSVKIYGIDKVHTKLYLNGSRAYFGSANFTRNGFSGLHESLLSTSDPQSYQVFSRLFSSYLADANRISVAQLQSLNRMFKSGRFVWKVPDTSATEIRASPLGDSQSDFRDWLIAENTENTRYIEARFDSRSGYNMSGHAYSAFNGLREFLRSNLDLIPELAVASYASRAFWNTYPDLVPRLLNFVLTEGHRFPGQDDGSWRNKLPTSLGGTPGSGGRAGGRGIGLIARMLIELSRYAVARGF